MSFWNAVGKVVVSIGKALFEEVKKNAEEVKKYKSQYAGKDDQALLKIIKNEIGAKRLAAFSLLKSRGWESDDIKTVLDLEKDLADFEKMSKEIG